MAKSKAVDQSYDSTDSRAVRESAQSANTENRSRRRGRATSRSSRSASGGSRSASHTSKSRSRTTRSYSSSRSRSRSRSTSRSRSRSGSSSRSRSRSSSRSGSGSDSDASVIRNRGGKKDEGSPERDAERADSEDGRSEDEDSPNNVKSKKPKEKKGAKKGEGDEEEAAEERAGMTSSRNLDGPLTPASQKRGVFTSFKRTLEANQPQALTYLNELGPMAKTANASRLQMLLKKGANKLSTTITPQLGANGLRFKDLAVADSAPSLQSQNQLKPVEVPTCVITLQHAKAVPFAGKMEEGHSINIRRARLCLYNGKAFVGNVQTVDHTIQDPMKPWNWTFKPANSTFYVRHQPEKHNGKTQALQVYLEITVGFAADRAALDAVSRLHRRKAAQVDEVAVAWCLFPLLGPHTAEQTLEVKMTGGAMTSPEHVTGPPQQLAATRAKLWNKITNKPSRDPMILLKMMRVPQRELATVNLLAPVMLIQPSLAGLVVTYREMLTRELLDANGDVHNKRTFSPAMATVPSIMDDDHLYATLATLWHQKAAKLSCSKAEHYTMRAETLEAVVLRVYPLLQTDNLPPPSLASDDAHSAARIQVINRYMEQPAQGPLSQDRTFFSTPFDISELSCRYADHVR